MIVMKTDLKIWHLDIFVFKIQMAYLVRMRSTCDTTISIYTMCKSLADFVMHVHHTDVTNGIYVNGISFLCIGRKSNLSSTFDCLKLFLHIRYELKTTTTVRIQNMSWAFNYLGKNEWFTKSSPFTIVWSTRIYYLNLFIGIIY